MFRGVSFASEYQTPDGKGRRPSIETFQRRSEFFRRKRNALRENAVGKLSKMKRVPAESPNVVLAGDETNN